MAWERSGNPEGEPVLVLHGGPGSGRSTSTRRFFDPDAYKIILYDQRGCGRSMLPMQAIRIVRPLRQHNGAPAARHGVSAPAFRRRPLAGLGHSWGCTLGITYAEEHAAHVAALMLVGVATCRRSEIDWLYHGVVPLFPEAWDRFREGVPEAERNGDLVAAYGRLLNDADPDIRLEAAKARHDWEASLSVDPKTAPPPTWSDPRFAWHAPVSSHTASVMRRGSPTASC